MGTIDTTEEERIYKLGDRYICMEFYGHCDECGKAHVQITEISEEQVKSCFEHIKIEEMPKWMEGKLPPIIISCEDLKSTIDNEVDNSFESLWCDELMDKECDSIPDKLKEKIESKFKKTLMKNIKGLD